MNEPEILDWSQVTSVYPYFSYGNFGITVTTGDINSYKRYFIRMDDVQALLPLHTFRIEKTKTSIRLVPIDTSETHTNDTV